MGEWLQHSCDRFRSLWLCFESFISRYPLHSLGRGAHPLSAGHFEEIHSMRELQSRQCRVSGRPVVRVVFFSLSLLLPLLCCTRASAQQRPEDELRHLDESVDALVKRVSPSVVQILVTGYGPLEEADRGSAGVVIGRQSAIGSGFIIDSDGYIITNAHVVNGAQRVQV